MNKITLGTLGNQPFEISAPLVSKKHAEITIDDDNLWTLKDLNSTNGTFVRDETTGLLKRISNVKIHSMSFICLGAENSKGCYFYARQVLNPQDYDEELVYMNRKEDEYECELEKLDRNTRNQKKIIFIINILVVLVTFIPSIDSVFKNIPEFRLNLMRIVPVISTFFTAFYDASGKKKELKERYERFHHCPNPCCSRKMKSSEIREGDCVKCHCQKS